MVTVANGTLLDRELAASHNITVRATSSDGSFSTAVMTINVNDVDEFDVGPITDSNASADAVNENAANGTTVGVTALASDADATNNTITYTLDDNAGGRFTIDGSTGVVTVADGTLLDRELAASHNITVRATSSDGSFNTALMTINVNDVDEFDVGPVTDADAAANTVAENATVGTAVGITALASDADATNSSITYTLDDDAGGRFAIDGSSGLVTVNAALDYETATSHNITVRATSLDGSFSTQSFTVNVSDVNESGITAISDTDAAADFVLENSANGSAVGITAFADDPDGTDTVSYSLDDNAGGRFSIDANSGLVTVASGIDREAAGSYDITVRATSTDTSSVTRVFTITIGDVDEFDVGPVTDSDGTANAVNENAANGTAVGVTALASDADATNNTISYTLDDNAGGRFTIDGSTGVVTVADGTLLDRELAASHNITVRATSSDGSFNTAIMTINVNDIDEFDVGPVTDSDGTANAVNENAANGTTVGVTALASDADATNNTISYTLDDNAGGRFTIDGSTGVVTVADGTLLDRELAASHNITVRATSQRRQFQHGRHDDQRQRRGRIRRRTRLPTATRLPMRSTRTPRTAPWWVSRPWPPTRTPPTTRSATRWTTTRADDLPSTDRPVSSPWPMAHCWIANWPPATTSRSAPLSSDGSFNTAVMTINVNDVDEFDVGPVTDSDATANAVNENAANGTVVGVTALASDADATNNTITYTLDDNAGGRFAIDGSTGVVTVGRRHTAGSRTGGQPQHHGPRHQQRRQLQHGRDDDQRQRCRRIRRGPRDGQRCGSEYRGGKRDGGDRRGDYGHRQRCGCHEQRDHLHAG